MSAVLAGALMLVTPSVASADHPREPPHTTSNADPTGGLRLMPLGDSNTWGGDWGSYRIQLSKRFETDGYKVDYVGSNNNGKKVLADGDNEGHSGQKINDVAALVDHYLSWAKPETVLLMLGTNDIYTNTDVPNAPARLSALIDKIRVGAPTAHIFVATIIPLADATLDAKAKTFNAAIPGIVASKDDKVHLVDMHPVLTTADVAGDGVHPGTEGFARMGDAWYAALLKVPGSIGTSSRTGVAQNYRLGDTNLCLDVYAALSTPLTRTQAWGCHGNANQKWTRTAAGELRVYGTSCLDLYGRVTAAGSPVVIYPCHGGANQKWTHRADGTLLHVLSGRCATTKGASTAQGTEIVIADCSTAAAQRWTAY